MREYWGSGLTGGGSGGGGGGGSVVVIPTAVALVAGNIVTLDTSGTLQLADPSLALSPPRYNAFGVSKKAYAPGAKATIFSDEITAAPMLFAVAPLATDNGKRVYLSTTPGVATVTPTGTGNALVLVGLLQGADGVTTTPDVLLQFQVVALDT